MPRDESKTNEILLQILRTLVNHGDVLENINSKLKFEGGVQFAFESIKDDSLATMSPNLPYLETIKFPFSFEYKINEYMTLNV